MQDSTITIGMPIKNRILCIDRVLDSLVKQTYPRNKLKLILIDESTDGTYERLLEFKEQYKDEYLAIDLRHMSTTGYISALRNLCVSNMTGDIMLFWDSDVIASTNGALSLIEQTLLGSDRIGAAGYNYERAHPSFYELLLRAKAELGGMGFTAIKRSMFGAVGLFNENLQVNEDREFFSRLKKTGYLVSLVSTVPFLHDKPGEKRVTFKDNILEFVNQLKLSFTHGAAVWHEGLKAGSLLDAVRTLYYLILPPVSVLLAINFFIPLIPIPIATILFVAYLGVMLVYHMWKTANMRASCIIAAFYYASLGVATSYGVVAKLFGLNKQ